MEACEVIGLFVNKVVVPPESKRRGNPGYGRLKALRVLVYSRITGLENDTRIVEHLKRHRRVVKALGLPGVPDRTTVGRWWRRCLSLLEEVSKRMSGMLQFLTPASLLIADSTPLVDLYDLEAKWAAIDVVPGRILRVPSQYSTIQEAIAEALPGYTIDVASGTYYEHIVVDKDDLKIVGGDSKTTMIDANMESGRVMLLYT